MAGVISKTANLYFTYKFLRTLVRKWEDQDAYKLGIIDENGKRLRRPKTEEERAAYNAFHRLAFNLKKVLEKLPFGKSRLASYAAALYLVKEHKQLTNNELCVIIEQIGEPADQEINEWFINEDYNISPGTYTLIESVCYLETGEPVGNAGSKVVIENIEPVDFILNQPIYEATHVSSNLKLYVTPGLLKK